MREANAEKEVRRLRKLLSKLAREFKDAIEHAGGVANASLAYVDAIEVAEEKGEDDANIS